jgi:hypothetical protein
MRLGVVRVPVALIADEVAPDRRRVDVLEVGEVDVIGLARLEEVLDRQGAKIVPPQVEHRLAPGLMVRRRCPARTRDAPSRLTRLDRDNLSARRIVHVARGCQEA